MKAPTFLVAALASLVAIVSAAPAPMPTPPGIPSASAAKTQLASLTVSSQVDDGKYDRDLFPTWDTIEGTCNTRYDPLLHEPLTSLCHVNSRS
jgi:hypothetical protein